MHLPEHAVHRLYQYRKAISSRPYMARGKNLVRCERCLLAQAYCTCQARRLLSSNASFLLLMYDDEVLKPSNSGRLIADLIEDTHAYIWSRTHTNRKVIELLNSEQYQPYLIFPSEYAAPKQQLVAPEAVPSFSNKRPLFVLLDGSWREAIKMFRKSAYLHDLPMLSFNPQTAAMYGLRKGSRDFQLGTAEVACLALGSLGETNNVQALNTWFELFIESSLFSRSRKSNHDTSILTTLTDKFIRNAP
ncbi:tRNA-uridine aminocarboxypropyltransferase [Shewanella waksmanii]|uniref:tRNA-uridine aminocarboxypropyltransferase n=1 Tax=Shewanella waksmanii TaxID=213783 RepID=UPI0037356615